MGQSATAPMICVVDDDEAVLNSLNFWLELEGFRVRAFRSASEIFALDPLACDCLVIDYRMEPDGLQLIAALKARGVKAPAILITTNPTVPLKLQALKAGVPIVEKPLLKNELLDTIKLSIAPSQGSSGGF